MADSGYGEAEAREDLFERLDDIRAGMLGVGGTDARMRPMTHFVDDEAPVLRFLTSRRSDLAREVGQGSDAHYCLVDDGDGYYAWIGGTVAPSADAAAVDEMWSPVTAAWFTGRDDPDILLLEMRLREAEVWAATDSTLQFGFEIVRANLDPEHEPAVGAHRTLRF